MSSSSFPAPAILIVALTVVPISSNFILREWGVMMRVFLEIQLEFGDDNSIPQDFNFVN
jgi:hypothetical protein